MSTKVGLLHLELRLIGVQSLKQKRGLLKPLIIRLQRKFQASIAEVDYHDKWQRSLLAVAVVSNDIKQLERSLQRVLSWLEKGNNDIELIGDSIEIIN
jgi:hypothetical protein